MPKCNGSIIGAAIPRYGQYGEGNTPLLDPPSSYERLPMRKSVSRNTMREMEMATDTTPPDPKISISPFSTRLPTSLKVNHSCSCSIKIIVTFPG